MAETISFSPNRCMARSSLRKRRSLNDTVHPGTTQFFRLIQSEDKDTNIHKRRLIAGMATGYRVTLFSLR